MHVNRQTVARRSRLNGVLWIGAIASLVASACYTEPDQPICEDGQSRVCECRDRDGEQAEYDAQTARDLQDLGEHGAALVLIQRVLNVNPDYPDIQFLRGYSQQMLDQNEEAIVSYQAQLATQPDHPLSTFNLAYAYMSLERWIECVDAFNRHLEVEPTSRDSYYHLSSCHTGAGHTAEAQAARARYDNWQ